MVKRKSVSLLFCHTTYVGIQYKKGLNVAFLWPFCVRILESLPTKVMPPHKAYCLSSNGPQFAHVAVFYSDGKSLA